MSRQSVPILMYHHVGPRPHPAFRKYMVKEQDFAAQLRWLSVAGYHPIDMEAFLKAREGLVDLPSRPVIITFDDGYRDCIDYAVPLLSARGFTAVFYLVAGLVGQTSSWLVPERGIELPLFDWQAARGLEAAGFQCGAHSMGHPHLAGLPSAECRRELADSRRLLEDQLGHPVRHMAYPYGSFDESVRVLAAEAGYSTACSTEIGISSLDDDLLALRRVPVAGEDSLVDFVWRLLTGRPLRKWIRGKAIAAARRSRQEGAPSAR